MKPLHLVAATDDLRPALQHIQRLNNNFYVTNANILLKIPETEVLNTELLELLPSECYFHAEQWKNSKIEKSTFQVLNETSGLIECYTNSMKLIGYLPFLTAADFKEKIVGSYPNVEAAIPALDSDLVEIDQIAFNPGLLNILYTVMGKINFKLSFRGKNKPILLKFLGSEATGLIMPVMLDF